MSRQAAPTALSRDAARRPSASARKPPTRPAPPAAIEASPVATFDEITLDGTWQLDASPPSPAVEVAVETDEMSFADAVETDAVETDAIASDVTEIAASPETASSPGADAPTDSYGDADASSEAYTEFDYAAAPSRFTEEARFTEENAFSEEGESTDDVGLPEARIDRLLDEASRAADDPAARMRMAEAFSEIAQQLGGAEAVPEGEDPGLFASAKELLSPEYYVKQWGRVAMRNRSEEVDDFGLDPAYQARVRPLLDAMYRRWFRAETHGIEHVPAEGRALLVGNHAGALPWDGVMLQTAVRLEQPAHREVRWLAEDFVAHSPFLGAMTNRLGAVRACPENAERLLSEDKLVAVFPEGEKGLGKPWARRYEIQRFGRGGFVKLALRMRTPIVPVAIVGSEETHPTLFRTDRLARLFGVPFLPITPTFPLLGPLGLVPLPSRWVIRFGKPIDLRDEPDRAAEDPVRVQFLAEEVRSAVQALVKRALEDRPRAF